MARPVKRIAGAPRRERAQCRNDMSASKRSPDPWIAAAGAGPSPGPLLWVAGAAALGFVIAFVGAAVLALPRPWFVLGHALASGALLALYWRCRRPSLRALWDNWPLGLGLGALAAAFSVRFVLAGPPSPGPSGAALAWDLAWLGLVYGMVDAALLTLLPVHAAWTTAQRLGWLRAWPGWLAAGVLALAASVAVTAAYHLGFPEFRGAAVLQPVIGNAVFTAVYILSGSPLAPLLAHVALHIAALLHAYAASVPLPPHYPPLG